LTRSDGHAASVPVVARPVVAAAADDAATASGGGGEPTRMTSHKTEPPHCKHASTEEPQKTL